MADLLHALEVHVWQAAAATSGAALAWRNRLRPFQHVIGYALAGAGTFLLGRWAGVLLLEALR